jgi:hypothetical protein
MPLMYAFVARGQSVLCEHAAYQGNFSKVAAECLAKCPSHNAKFTYNADKHTFNFIVHDGYSARPTWRRGARRRAGGSARARGACAAQALRGRDARARRTPRPALRARADAALTPLPLLPAAFLAVADEEFGRQIPFGFLEKIKDDFLKNYGESAKNAVAMSLQRVYRRVSRRSVRASAAARARLGAAGEPARLRRAPLSPRSRNRGLLGLAAPRAAALHCRAADARALPNKQPGAEARA